jgi:hypothetical protein
LEFGQEIAKSHQNVSGAVNPGACISFCLRAKPHFLAMNLRDDLCLRLLALTFFPLMPAPALV